MRACLGAAGWGCPARPARPASPADQQTNTSGVDLAGARWPGGNSWVNNPRNKEQQAELQCSQSERKVKNAELHLHLPAPTHMTGQSPECWGWAVGASPARGEAGQNLFVCIPTLVLLYCNKLHRLTREGRPEHSQPHSVPTLPTRTEAGRCPAGSLASRPPCSCSPVRRLVPPLAQGRCFS